MGEKNREALIETAMERERERWFVQTYLNLFQTLQILREVFQGKDELSCVNDCL